jgi:hypothetical protein
VQPTSSRANAVSSAYPHKGRKVSSNASSAESAQSAPTRIPVPKAVVRPTGWAADDLSAQLGP